METYEHAIEFLFGRINYERALSGSYSTSDFKLDRMRQLLSLLGEPQQRLPAVHVAGTKGKGSTAVMVARILQAAGYRVGLFTSPHISAFEERMTVDGVPPRPEVLVELARRLAGPVASMDGSPGPMSPTYFELATALAWLYFSECGADVAVLEVGLGGRLDATNVCNTEAAVITNISRDHTALLGSTLAEIAAEKAGIIKPEVPVVSGVMDDEARCIVEHVCREQGAKLFQLGRELRYRCREDAGLQPTVAPAESARGSNLGRVDVETPWRSWPAVPMRLIGEHQARNTALAVGVVDVLRERGWRVPSRSVYDGLANVDWPLRIETVRNEPLVIVDAAHNWASMAALLKTLKASVRARRRILVFGSTKDKDVWGLLRQVLPEFDTVIVTQYLNNPRAVPAAEVCRMVETISDYPVHLATDPASAWKIASRLSTPEDLICVTGSFFIAAEMREIILDDLRRTGRDDRAAEQASPLYG